MQKYNQYFEITFELRNEKKPNIILTKEIEISIISLKRIEEAYKEDKNNKKVQWMMFFNNPNSEEVEEIMERNKAINDAQIIIHKMTPEESKRAREWREEKLKLEKYDIYEAGKDDEKQAIAKKLKEMGLGIEQIIEATGLTKEEIENIK